MLLLSSRNTNVKVKVKGAFQNAKHPSRLPEVPGEYVSTPVLVDLLRNTSVLAPAAEPPVFSKI